MDKLMDKLERLVFGATARETVEMRVRLAEQQLEQRTLAALESDEESTDDERAMAAEREA